MNDEPILTEFDGMIQNEHHQLLKAALPYMQPAGQKLISLLVKLQELHNTFLLFQETEGPLHACSTEKRNLSTLEMLSDIKRFCPKRDQETIESMLNFINMYNLYNTYSQAMSGMDASGDPVSQLKNMLTPEQRSLFESYMSQMS